MKLQILPIGLQSKAKDVLFTRKLIRDGKAVVDGEEVLCSHMAGHVLAQQERELGRLLAAELEVSDE